MPRFSILLHASLFAACGLACARWTYAQEVNFHRDIRPILAENCFYCHGQDANKRQAELRLDDRQAAIDASAIVPGDSGASEMIARILSEDPSERMPPTHSGKMLTPRQKQLLTEWIDKGAEYPRHWAFVPPQLPMEPNVQDESWIRNPIDRFVLQRLEAEGLPPSPEADRATLIKRLSIDLTGLPPSIEEMDRFIADDDPQAYEKLVDRLLASPHYGERMALPWLDAARYADSNGFQQDGDTWQWMWRDWVARALNDDLPFDQFTIWQLAGDLLPDATQDQKIASGFNRNHLLNGEGGAIAEEQRFVILFDRVDTTATTWLGLTIACAQCHDHKYDPVMQRDYYAMLDAFNRVPETGVPQFFSTRIRVDRPFLELSTPENQRRLAELDARIGEQKPDADQAAEAAFVGWKTAITQAELRDDSTQLSESLRSLLAKPAAERTADESSQLESQLKLYFDKHVRPGMVEQIPALKRLAEIQKERDDYASDQVPRVMVMSDHQPRETFILSRGEYLSPLEKVEFATPAFLPPAAADLPRNRLGLARWLVDPQHPLTARVQVNRMWQYFFGTGLVKTSEDFGLQSEYPTHPDLLDWLAIQFQRGGWSMKAMHRLIVTSATYRQSSRQTELHRTRDPENRLLARATRTRMPSMVLRDWALAASDLLNRESGGAPVYPYQPEDVWESLAITKERDFTYPQSSGAELYRRSLYTFWRRTVAPANMFDASNRQACRVRQATTSTPLHALTTLNDPTWIDAARALARRSRNAAQEIDGQLTYAFRRVACRKPTERDLQLLRTMFDRQLVIYQQHPENAARLINPQESDSTGAVDDAQSAALTAVCLAIFNLDESLCRE